MSWIDQVLNNPAQREAIGWLAGGVAVLASGIWAVVRFLIERRKGGNKAGSHAGATRVNQTITASGSSVAAGRDANVGVKGAYVVILVLFLVAILLFGLSAFGDSLVRSAVGENSSIPKTYLSLSCGLSGSNNPYQVSASERKNLIDFVDFVRRNQDRVVYLDVRIDQECAACQCARSIEEDSENLPDYDEPYTGALYIDDRTAEEQRDGPSGWDKGASMEWIELKFFSPSDLAVSHEIFLPRPEHLTEPQYRTGEYGTFARFDGLFTARFSGGTAGNRLRIDVLDPSDQQGKQLRCIREESQLSVQQRLYLGC